MTGWNNWTPFQPVQFEWEDNPQPRVERLVSGSARVDEGRASTTQDSSVAPVDSKHADRTDSPCRLPLPDAEEA